MTRGRRGSRRRRRRPTTRCRPARARRAPPSRPCCRPARRPRCRRRCARKLSPLNSCCGLSNELVVRRLNWPENGVAAEKVRGQLRRRAIRPRWSAPKSAGVRRPASPRRRSRPVRRILQDAPAAVPKAPGGLAVIVVAEASARGGVRRRRPRSAVRQAARSPLPAVRRPPRAPAARRRTSTARRDAARRSAIDEDARLLGRTSTILPARRDESAEMRAQRGRDLATACEARTGRCDR